MTRPKSVAGSTWPVLVFSLIVLGAGLAGMAALSSTVTTGAIAALVTAVLGVVGTHVGHVAGHELATQQSTTVQLSSGLEQLSFLHTAGKLSDDEFAAAKRRILGLTPTGGVTATAGELPVSL